MQGKNIAMDQKLSQNIQTLWMMFTIALKIVTQRESESSLLCFITILLI